MKSLKREKDKQEREGKTFKRRAQMVKRKQKGVKGETSKRTKETKLQREREMHILGKQNRGRQAGSVRGPCHWCQQYEVETETAALRAG